LTIAITPATERGRVETLDLLRAVAVLAVLFYHYAFRGAAADAFTDVSLPALVPLAKYASLGVQLFFVISGFVIAYSPKDAPRRLRHRAGGAHLSGLPALHDRGRS
jgi:peptidoglycan/LPS O-acetylase OafA/YrhL